MRAIPAVASIMLAAALLTGCHGSPAQRHTLVFEVVGPGVGRPSVDHVVSVLRNRLDALHIRDVDVRPERGGRIAITTSRPLARPARGLLTTTGSLAFYDLEADIAPVSRGDHGSVVAATDVDRLAAKARAAAPSPKPASFFLFDRRARLLAGPEPTRSALGAEPADARVVALPAHETMISCTASPSTGCPGAASPSGTYWYVFRHYPVRRSNPVPEMTGADLKLSTISAQAGTQPAEGEALVMLGFTSGGNKKFREITRAEAERGQALADAAGQGQATDVSTVLEFAQHFAIVLDNQLLSTPYIDYKQTPKGIDPTHVGAEISNLPSAAHARDLAILLRSGALPFRLVPVR